MLSKNDEEKVNLSKKLLLLARFLDSNMAKEAYRERALKWNVVDGNSLECVGDKLISGCLQGLEKAAIKAGFAKEEFKKLFIEPVEMVQDLRRGSRGGDYIPIARFYYDPKSTLKIAHAFEKMLDKAIGSVLEKMLGDKIPGDVARTRLARYITAGEWWSLTRVTKVAHEAAPEFLKRKRGG